ncbi:hypothetical protein HAX54_046692, partial [Datura stramonium]|nr:hypothetical protein [Datura stramonium]
MERETRPKIDENMQREIHNLKETFKSILVHKGYEGIEYEHLCVPLDIKLPVGYKVLKFDIFDGKGNPHACLRRSPNVRNNPPPNHEIANVNMITIDEECSLEGTIVSVKNKEKVASSTFVAPIITVQTDAKSKGKGKLVVEITAVGMTRSGQCYTPEE